ncbi:DNA alkylation repair protein [Candidatus Saccharibacteria bacterium]|nr:DNA alkylation repair protein [Candidatus Saccharibacteria bacterium]
MITTFSDLRTALASHAEDPYRDFIMKGIPSNRPFLGVRIPLIREIVKQIPQDKLLEFLEVNPVAFEEVIARGMIICRLPYQEALNHFDSQIAHIDDWCTCDTFCAEFSKLIHNNKIEFFETKIEKLLESGQEFLIRAGLVILKCAYIEPEYLAVIFDRIESLKKHEAYYVRMSIAWLLAECFIKFPSATTGYLAVSNLPSWTFNKTISKICDSYRVDDDTKILLRKMRQRPHHRNHNNTNNQKHYIHTSIIARKSPRVVENIQ